MSNPVYRITVQLLDEAGNPGELVELMEMERPAPWTTIFDFVDQYRAEVAAEEAGQEPEPDHNDEVKFCPNCERPNQFGELCAACSREEQDAIDAGESWHDQREGNGYPAGTIGAETR